MTLRSLRRLLVAFLSLGLILAACGDDDGAGGSSAADDDPRRDAYVEALTAELASDEDFAEFGEADEASECLAGVLVDTVGTGHLADEGIEPEDFAGTDSFADMDIELDDGQVDELATAIEGCIDLRQLMADTAPDGFGCLVDTIDVSALTRGMAEEFATGAPFDPSSTLFDSATPECAEEAFLSTGVAQGDITEDDAACIADALEDGVALSVLQSVAATGSPTEADAAEMEAAFTACGVSP